MLTMNLIAQSGIFQLFYPWKQCQGCSNTVEWVSQPLTHVSEVPVGTAVFDGYNNMHLRISPNWI